MTTLLLGMSRIAGAQPNADPGAAPKSVTDLKPLPVPDYARWRSITSPLMSSDGQWVAWVYTQVRHDDQLHVKQVDGTREFVVEGAARPVFSDDGKWIAYAVTPPSANRAAGGRGGGGRGGAPAPAVTPAPGGTGAAPTPPTPPRAELMNLATGAKTGWDATATFGFSRGSGFFAVQRARAEPRPKFDGTDLIVRDLKSGNDRLIGSVAEHAFNKPGTLLAWTVDAADALGNGVYVAELGTGIDRVLENARERYSRLTWADSGMALAAMHGTDADTLAQRENTLVAFTGVVPGGQAVRVEVKPGSEGVPAQFAISEKGAINWSERADRVFFGLKSQDVKPRRRTDDESLVAASDVDIFHGADDRIQSVQRSQANAERNRTDRAVLTIASRKVMRVADSTSRTAQVTRDGRWAVLGDDHKYVSDWEEPRADYTRLDVATGERTPVITALGRSLGLSTDSRYFLYWKDKHVWAYDLAANRHVNLTANAPVSFVNVEDDHTGDKPAYGVTGFTKDGKSVILDHRYDLWLVSLDGTAPPRNLTNGVGTKNEMRLRYERTEPAEQPATPPGGGGGGGRGGGAVQDRSIDLSKPILLSAYGQWTKKSGYYELKDGQLRELVYQDKAFGTRVEKAANSDRYLFTREDWTEYPDLQVSDLEFKNPKKVSDANPQQAEYRWGHRILFDFKDKDGHRLQGTLAIPDGYVSGTKLPMLVNFYEKNSQNLHRYQTPRYATAPQFAGYVSNGYLVMQPDIYFHTRTSHADMLNSVESAVRKVIEMGYADPAHVGLQGHSYSGGGSAYISTRSKMFAAVVAGAAPIDLVSEFNTLFRGSGQNNHSYDIRGQGRYGTNPYDDFDLFWGQSPISGVRTMNTALLQMQGDNDQTVEYLQGMEFYNALRFNHKNVIFLSYPGEDHGLRKIENQVDYEIRMGEFFDHYLKNVPAPAWMTSGDRFVDKDKRKPIPINLGKPKTTTATTSTKTEPER
jgi:dipeptidyl aminopeptidase/acylaminoacyl peptidase